LTNKTIFYCKQGGNTRGAGNTNVEDEERKRKKGKTGNKKLKKLQWYKGMKRGWHLYNIHNFYFCIAIYQIFSLKGIPFEWVLGVAVLSGHRNAKRRFAREGMMIKITSCIMSEGSGEQFHQHPGSDGPDATMLQVPMASDDRGDFTPFQRNLKHGKHVA